MNYDILIKAIELLEMAANRLHEYEDRDTNDFVALEIDRFVPSVTLNTLRTSIQEMIHQATKTAYEMHGWAVTEGLITKDSIARGMEMNDYATDLYTSIKDLQEAMGVDDEEL